MNRSIAGLMCFVAVPAVLLHEPVAAETVFTLTEGGRDVVVEAVDDPVVNGITCYLSLAKSVPGIDNRAVIGAKEPTQISIACRQTGRIAFRKPVALQEEVFETSNSPILRNMRLRVVRIVDRKRKTLTYLTFPETAITTVAVPNRDIPLK